MAFTHELAVDVLNSIPQYKDEFKRAFSEDKINIDKVTQAIAEFEKTLVTPDSRFDLWLKGDAQILTKQELSGYNLFKSAGCIACHSGEAVGGNSFQKMGLVKPYITKSKSEGLKDKTGKESYRFKFKVPTLRNIELSYPYFHDGAVQTLAEAVNVMGEIQLGRQFNQQENADIVAFLKTLTGEQPSFALPQLPPSTPSTPTPKPFS